MRSLAEKERVRLKRTLDIVAIFDPVGRRTICMWKYRSDSSDSKMAEDRMWQSFQIKRVGR